MRNFLDNYQERKGPLSQYGVDKRKYQFDLHETSLPMGLQESSFCAAKSLLHDMVQMQNPSSEVQHALSYGVPVGFMDRKVFPNSIIANIIQFFTCSGIPVQDMPHILKSNKHLPSGMWLAA